MCGILLQPEIVARRCDADPRAGYELAVDALRSAARTGLAQHPQQIAVALVRIAGNGVSAHQPGRDLDIDMRASLELRQFGVGHEFKR